MLNTAFIERLNATFRQGLASLTRRSRHAARRLKALETGMFLIGCTYNFCFAHHELSKKEHVGSPSPSRSASQGGLMFLHRLVGSYRRDASQEILQEVRKDMQCLSKAQMLLFEAERYQSPATLMLKNQLVMDAVALWPSFRPVEYRKLGDDFSRVIMGSFYRVQGGTVNPQGVDIPKEQLFWYTNQAIYYLEETTINAGTPDREGLVNLACMYGCAGQYDKMIRIIEKAVQIDDNAKDDLKEAKRLSLLAFACGSHKSLIEKLGKKIGLNLPMPREEFTRQINDVDLVGRSAYIQCFAMSKVFSPTENSACILKFFVRDAGTGRLIHSGGYYRATNPSTHYDSLVPSGKEISADDFAEKVYQDFFVICFQDN